MSNFSGSFLYLKTVRLDPSQSCEKIGNELKQKKCQSQKEDENGGKNMQSCIGRATSSGKRTRV